MGRGGGEGGALHLPAGRRSRSLSASPVAKVDVGAHPNGLAINPDGSLLLAAATDGTLKVLSISGKELKLADSIKISDRRLASVSFTHDGTAALVGLGFVT